MEEDIIEYWIWLQQAVGQNSTKPEKLLEHFGSIGGVYEARRVDYLNAGFLSEKEIRRLCDKSLEKSKEIVGKCMELGYKIMTLPELPQRLRGIYAPPCVLYLWGTLPQPENGIYISMVGTRNVTAYGVEAATKLAAGLAHCGAVVVSGMAIGVDGCSHKGALKGGGKTVAVIGCGIDIEYPSQHVELKRLIAQNGAVLSEYPPGARPDRMNFPARNRIIAGLTLGCVVVEAGSRSGSLITASLAAEMGRDIFAVPGSIFSPYSDGTNRLLRDGAKPACNVLDILEEYIGLCPQSIIARMSEINGNPPGEQLSFDSIKQEEKASIQQAQKTAVSTKISPSKKQLKAKIEKSDEPVSLNIDNEKLPDATLRNKSVVSNSASCPTAGGASCPTAGGANCPTANGDAAQRNNLSASHSASCPTAGGLSEKQMKVYDVLTDSPEHVDSISIKANLELRVVLAVLTTLEIEGYAQSHPGRRYTVMR